MSSSTALAEKMKTETPTNTTINPATGEEIKTYKLQSGLEAAQTVDEAHEAFLKWREKPVSGRADIIRQIAAALKNNKDRMARMMTLEMGKPLELGKGEVESCIAICEYTADHCPARLKEEKREIPGGYGIITYQPLGVILAIEPWNFPLYQVIRYAIPNLLAGNTSVLKHAKNVWGCATIISEIFKEAGLPDGAFGLLFIENDEVEAIIANEKIRGVTLTGSAEAGKIVSKLASENLKKSLLELGGSDPYIVLEDADLNEAIMVCIKARIVNGGQTCTSAKRFIVMDEVYDEFRKKFVAAMKMVKYGDPNDPANDMGPLAREDLRDSLHEQVTSSIEKGAKCLLGGNIPEGEGYYYPPTVLEDVKPGMPAYDDELFGPVASLFRVSSEEEAIRIANDHKYGLGGGIFSRNIERATEIARTKIDTGMVNINTYSLAKPNMPFGGVKASGFGREHGGFGVREFVNVKSISVKSADK